ncbi:MAG: inosine/xanthosine triphosphatase [Calditrichia bacterium]
MEVVNRLIIGSKNPVKIEAVRSGFVSLFPNKKCVTEGIVVTSGVADQPMSDEETLLGAENRAKAAQNAIPEADFWFGVEGGIAEMEDELSVFAWIVALAKSGKKGRGRTATFFLPPPVASLVRRGIELGDADDQVYGTSNSKQNNGAAGLLSGNVITRTTLYEPAVVMALFPFRNANLYP